MPQADDEEAVVSEGPRVSACPRREQNGCRPGSKARIEEGAVDIKDFQAVLGRLCFAVGPLEYTRHFLAPLYAWLASIPPAGRFPLPWSIRFLISFLAEQFGEEYRAMVMRPRGVNLGVAFRADAKAEGQNMVIGGWECVGDCVRWSVASRSPRRPQPPP